MTDISFDVHQSEIVGVAALEGQGQRELLRMLAGVEPVRSGSIEVEGRALHAATPASALRAGIGFVPKERKTEGIFLGLGTAANSSLPILARLRRFGLIDRERERGTVRVQAERG